MFNLDYEEMPYEDAPSPDFKQANPTAFTSRNDYTKSATPTALLLTLDRFPAPLENSMDRDIYLANARMANKGFLDYLRACITDSSSVETLILNNKIFGFRGQEGACEEEIGGLEAVVSGN